ncbi:hypothetical protein [Dichelobacter nodosus]|uniref:hypothetical protein n=1 Tax=Dichelobacter nodosus TaxID=870 RepID=UPI00067FDBA4|nr:hypothetical protein [Dichelobacter nodosus]KNZ39964.1 hypothetical protein AKG33_01050 [Dichelobacter nodosus]
MAQLTFKFRALIAVLLFFIWSCSLTAAYRYGMQKKEILELRNLQRTVMKQTEQYRQMIHDYDKLATEFVHNQNKRENILMTLEGNIRAYLSNTHSNCTIDDRGLQLINSIIADPTADRTNSLGTMPPLADIDRWTIRKFTHMD